LKKKKNMKNVTLSVCLLIVFSIALNTVGCSVKVQATNLMEGVKARNVELSDDLSEHNAEVTDFAVRLFKTAEMKGKNTLISPLSVLCALSMTANGAKGETLSQMESVLGMNVADLNNYLHSYMKKLPQGDKYKLNLANSIWFTDDESFSVKHDFLQTNADYFGADLYKTPFDNKTLKDINNWIKNKTDGTIPKMLDSITPDAVMYLVNALVFEAEWSEIYEKSQVKTGTFTREDDSEQDIEFMYGTEGTYLEDEKATGFIKKYKGGKYAFAALLPKADVTVSEYISYLDGGKLNKLLSAPQYTTVYTAIPKFETEYSVGMKKILSEMGMPIAFSGGADFSGIGNSKNGGIYISEVLHKTFISVGEKGTKAGAATVVEMKCGSAGPAEKPKTVYLDRPFVYMLIDCENNIPFFIGSMMNVEK